MTIIQVSNRVCPSCAAGSPTLRSLRRAIRPGDAPLVGQQVLQAQVQRGSYIREIMLDRRTIRRWCGLPAGISLA